MPQFASLCDPCSSKAESSRCALCGGLVVAKVGGAGTPAPLCASHQKSDSAKTCFLCKARPAGATPARICKTCAQLPFNKSCVICRGGIDFDDARKLLGGLNP